MTDHNKTMACLVLSALYLIILIYLNNRQPNLVPQDPEPYHYLDGFEELAKDTNWLKMYEMQINSFDSLAYE